MPKPKGPHARQAAASMFKRHRHVPTTKRRMVPLVQGNMASCMSEVVSGKPMMRLRFCMAWPLAPLTRLSITLIWGFEMLGYVWRNEICGLDAWTGRHWCRPCFLLQTRPLHKPRSARPAPATHHDRAAGDAVREDVDEAEVGAAHVARVGHDALGQHAHKGLGRVAGLELGAQRVGRGAVLELHIHRRLHAPGMYHREQMGLGVGGRSVGCKVGCLGDWQEGRDIVLASSQCPGERASGLAHVAPIVASPRRTCSCT